MSARWILCLAVILTVLGPATAAAELRWVGCGISKKAFMGALAAAYQERTGTLITLEGGGATRGVREVAAGQADLGGSCRHKLLVDEETGANLIPIGWDALVAIVHPDNPVSDITTADLEAVMTGSLVDWQALGGPAGAIALAVRQGRISGVGRMARELIFKDPDAAFSPDAAVFRSSGPVEQFVESEPLAIALTGISSARKRAVKVLSIDGAPPTYENVASGTYGLFRPLYLVVGTDPSPDVARFVAFAKGREGQRIIRDQGTVTLRDGASLWPRYRETMRQARQVGNF